MKYDFIIYKDYAGNDKSESIPRDGTRTRREDINVSNKQSKGIGSSTVTHSSGSGPNLYGPLPLGDLLAHHYSRLLAR